MAEANNVAPLPTEDPSKTSFDEETSNEALDLINNETSALAKEAANDDETVKELTKTDRAPKADDTEKELKEETAEDAKQVTQAVKEAIANGADPSEIEQLKQQLQFYQTLFGEQPQNNPQPQNNNQQQQQVQQAQNNQQQQQNILDNVNVTQEELLGLLSGDPERAVPVIKKFIATAIVLAQHDTAQKQQMQDRQARYISGIQEAFYDRYKDLKEERFLPLVKFAGDAVHQEYLARGITKYPHELIDDIGKRAMQLRDQLLAQVAGNGNGNGTKQPKQVIRQGEVGGTKVTPPPKEKLTEQQDQMFDLLNE